MAKPESPTPYDALKASKGMPHENLVRAAHLYDQARCGDNVKDATAKGVCAMAKAGEFFKLSKLSRFVEELGEKFVSTLGEERFKTKDPYQILKLLETEGFCNWHEIMKRFNKAKTYKIFSNDGKKPARIEFAYKNGKKEIFPLEIILQPEPGINKINSYVIRGNDNTHATDKMNKEMKLAIAKPDSGKKQEDEPTEMDFRDRQNQYLIDLVERSKKIKTPNDAYEQLANSTQFLSDPLLRELSEPLCKVASYFSKIDVNKQDMESQELIALTDKVSIILNKYYPGFSEDKSNISRDEMEDLGKISKLFGIV